MAWYVYILRCAGDTLYTGCTGNLPRRLEAHRQGKGAKYTRSHPPKALVYWEAAADRSQALRREAAVKRLLRREKLALAAQKEPIAMIEMRRKDRQTTEHFAWEVVDRCAYGVLSMISEEGVPYGLPLSIVRQGTDVYFHCAPEGRKIQCLRAHPQVSLTCVEDVWPEPERFTTRYASALLLGTAEEVTEETEKIQALRLLCQRYAPENMAGFQAAVEKSLGRTAVWKIAVQSITGKANR